MMVQRAQGTEDLIGEYMRAWECMQQAAADVFGTYGFDRIETPTIEQLDTFVHSIGESTDVVRKEMFRVISGELFLRVMQQQSEAHLKPRQRLALRPEGTAAVVRAVVEENLVPAGAAPAKLWYGMPMFRGERPQKGRLRQFYQIGIEWIGASDPVSDAECICMVMSFLERLGFARKDIKLLINSMGDAECRSKYRDKVRAFILDHKDPLCSDCLERADINPLRAFDCKNPRCREVMQDAPRFSDNYCPACKQHYEDVKSYLEDAGITYHEDATLVRGLDYYTRTVFELVYAGDETIGALGGGGRYDGLVELEGGRPTPGIGFAVGFERIMLACISANIKLGGRDPVCVYVACADPSLRRTVFEISRMLREAGVRTECDYQGRSLKSQFKQAHKAGAVLCIIAGPDEIAADEVSVRDMVEHTQTNIPLTELVSAVTNRLSDVL